MDVNDILMEFVFNVTETLVSTSVLNLNVTEPNVTDTTEIPVSVFSTYPKELLQFGAACFVFFIFLGVPGNILTVIALLKTPRLRNATTAFIVNLCLADAFFCAISIPLETYNFLHSEWIPSDSTCVFFAMVRFTNAAVSILTISAITINRYVLICHPSKYHKIFNKCHMTIMIISLWLTALATFFPTLIEVWGRFGFDPAVSDCTILEVRGKSPKTIIIIFFCFVLPTTVFSICYAKIYLVVRKSSKNCQPSDSRVKKQKKDLRLLKIVTVIYGAFVLCFIPVSVVKVLKKENDLPVINILGYLGLFFSACLNPIIYVVMSKEYRKAYTNILTRKTATNHSTSTQS